MTGAHALCLAACVRRRTRGKWKEGAGEGERKQMRFPVIPLKSIPHGAANK